MLLKNSEIYEITEGLLEHFNDASQRLPVKINFFLQRNKKTLIDLAREIESSRVFIAETYGEKSGEDGNYRIPADKMEQAQKELSDLFNLEQEVPIQVIRIEDIDPNLEFSAAQMEALLFMIK